MTDLLSQDEIDALLHGVDDVDDVDEPMDAGDESAVSFDFSSQDRIVRGRMPALELIDERFARRMRISLFNMLRKTADHHGSTLSVYSGRELLWWRWSFPRQN